MKYLKNFFMLFIVALLFSFLFIVGFLGFGFSVYENKFVLNYIGVCSLVFCSFILFIYYLVAKRFVKN